MINSTRPTYNLICKAFNAVVVDDDEELMEILDPPDLLSRLRRRSSSMLVVGSSKKAMFISDSSFGRASQMANAAAICSPPDKFRNGRSRLLLPALLHNLSPIVESRHTVR